MRRSMDLAASARWPLGTDPLKSLRIGVLRGKGRDFEVDDAD
jgi:hypothetical protein